MKTPILKKYFWDVDFKNLDVKKHKEYVLERILELGDQKAAEWMLKYFSQKDILKVLKKSRRISSKSRIFWNLLLKR